MSKGNQFIKNLAAAFIAQGISLLLSVLMSLILPRFLGIMEYSYWQLFMFYIGYVFFFQFGLNDGMYLRLGGTEYQNLDFRKLGTELRIFTIIEIVIAILISVFAIVYVNNYDRKIVLILATEFLVVQNLIYYFGYIFQAANETRLFSFSSIIDCVFTLIVFGVLLLLREADYIPFIVVYSLGKLFALIYCCIKGKEILFSRGYNVAAALQDMWKSMSIGIKLTISGVASMLVLGTGRQVIDRVWGIATFGKISLSLTMTNFFLVFLKQISMVMFPALRRVDDSMQETVYVRLREVLGIILPIVLVGYVPMRAILGMWLPQYAESLRYLALLLPICTFEGKMQMLYTTYFKVIRGEKALLNINMISLAVSALLVSVGGFLLKNLFVVILSMLFAIAFRSVLAEVILSRKMGITMDYTIWVEIGFVIVFIISAWFCSTLVAFSVHIAAYAFYLLLNRSRVNNCVSMVANKWKFI